MSCLDYVYFLHHFQGNIMMTTGYYFIQDILQCKCHILIMYLFGSVSNIILRAFCHTDFSSLGLHREITLVYFFAIPMILYYLSKPVILVFIEIDRLSTCKKTINSYQPILWLRNYPSNHDQWKYTTRKKRRKRRFNKPQPLYHLTTRGRIYIGTKILLLCIPEVHDTIKQWIEHEVLGVYIQWFQIIKRSILTSAAAAHSETEGTFTDSVWFVHAFCQSNTLSYVMSEFHLCGNRWRWGGNCSAINNSWTRWNGRYAYG